MTCLCIIPAKKYSSRLKNKNFKLFNKKPLIHWTIKIAKESKIFDDIIVSTDCKKIKKYAIIEGVKSPFIRPKYLSKNNSTMKSVVQHALKFQEKLGSKYKYICILQPTSPLRNVQKVRKIFNFFKNKNFDSLTTIKKLKHTSHPDFVFKKKNKLPGKIIQNIQNKGQLEFKKNYFCLDGGYLFFIKSKHLNKNILTGTVGLYEITDLEGQDIDTLDDFKIAELIHKNLNYIV